MGQPTLTLFEVFLLFIAVVIIIPKIVYWISPKPIKRFFDWFDDLDDYPRVLFGGILIMFIIIIVLPFTDYSHLILPLILEVLKNLVPNPLE